MKGDNMRNWPIRIGRLTITLYLYTRWGIDTSPPYLDIDIGYISISYRYRDITRGGSHATI